MSGRDPIIRRWLRDETISPKEQAKLDLALNRMRTLDFQLISSTLLAGPLRGRSKLYKLRIRCQNRELRPLLCRGPITPPEDFTLLLGAIETGGKLRPADAEARAAVHREELIANPGWRSLL